MTKEQQDLLHYMNKTHQLQQLLEAEREKNKRLVRAIAEIKFEGRSLLKRLEKL
jgi:hypothetical protein